MQYKCYNEEEMYNNAKRCPAQCHNNGIQENVSNGRQKVINSREEGINSQQSNKQTVAGKTTIYIKGRQFPRAV